MKEERLDPSHPCPKCGAPGIEVCAGCGCPTHERDCGCPAGTAYICSVNCSTAVKEMEKLLDKVFAAYQRMSELTGRNIMNFDVYPLNKLTLLKEVKNKIKDRAEKAKAKASMLVPESKLFADTSNQKWSI
jgi:hypothetical protein